MRSAKEKRKRSQNSVPLLLSAMFLLSSCGVTANDQGTAAAGGSSVTLAQGTADGTGDSAIADASETSVEVTPASGSAWNSFLVDLGSHFLADNICAGKTIFGRAGEAACAAVFDNRFRDKGTTTTRIIPVVAKDTDGHYDTNVNKLDHSVLNACGTSQPSVDERIAHCASVNPGLCSDVSYTTRDTCVVAGETWTSSTWSGSSASNSGHGDWKLVSKTTSGNGGKEVWRDERTKKLWSDFLGNIDGAGDPTGGQSQQYFGWCFASGNTENAGGVDCRTAQAGSYNRAAVSLCAEDDDLLTPDGAHNTNQAANAVTAWVESGTAIIDAKAGMKLVTSPSVEWRLPNREDYFQAYANGMTYVLPRFQNYGFWTSSVTSDNPSSAWYFYADAGGGVVVSSNGRDDGSVVRCVGQ
jgi:hypothetical protein